MSIYKKGNIWHIYFVDADGKRVRKSTGHTDKEKAQELHDKLKSQRWDERYLAKKQHYVWEQAVVRYLQEHCNKKSLITDKYNLRWLDKHLRSRYLHEITRKTLDELKDAKLKTGASNATVNRMLSTVKKILATAQKEWEWIDSVPTVKMLVEPKERVRWLTKDDAFRLFDELPDHILAMVKFTLSTGLRESNVTQLTWQQVDMQRKCAWIHAMQSKSGKAIAVPLNADAISVLKSQIGKHEKFVFTYKNKRIIKANSSSWRKALIRAGIDDFRWHDLRHTWASWHIQAGTPLNVLKELGGWADIDMVLRYAHLSSDHLSHHADAINITMGNDSTFTPPAPSLRIVK